MLTSVLLTELHTQFLMSLLLSYIHRDPVLSVGTYRDFQGSHFLSADRSVFSCLFFPPESGSQVAQGVLKLDVLPRLSLNFYLLSFKCSDYRHAPPYLACILPF